MAVRISEEPTVDQMKSQWAGMVMALRPDIEILPEPWKSAIKGPTNLMIDSKTSLGIIPEKRLWATVEHAEYIHDLITKYGDLLGEDPVRYIINEIGKYFSILNIGMCLNGRFVLEGPMSSQFVTQTSKLIQVGSENIGQKSLTRR